MIYAYSLFITIQLVAAKAHVKQLKLEFPKIVIVIADENPSCSEEINNRFCFNAPFPFLLGELKRTDKISDLQQFVIILKRKFHFSIGKNLCKCRIQKRRDLSLSSIVEKADLVELLKITEICEDETIERRNHLGNKSVVRTALLFIEHECFIFDWQTLNERGSCGKQRFSFIFIHLRIGRLFSDQRTNMNSFFGIEPFLSLYCVKFLYGICDM